MHDGENNVKGENKEVREKLKGTRAKEESKRIREEVKVQIVLREENKIHDGRERKCEAGK